MAEDFGLPDLIQQDAGAVKVAGRHTDMLQVGIGDSGASEHLHDTSMNGMLHDAKPSHTRYTAAVGYIHGDSTGQLQLSVPNLECIPAAWCPRLGRYDHYHNHGKKDYHLTYGP